MTRYIPVFCRLLKFFVFAFISFSCVSNSFILNLKFSSILAGLTSDSVDLVNSFPSIVTSSIFPFLFTTCFPLLTFIKLYIIRAFSYSSFLPNNLCFSLKISWIFDIFLFISVSEGEPPFIFIFLVLIFFLLILNFFILFFLVIIIIYIDKLIIQNKFY